jgi:hypothetical protein
LLGKNSALDVSDIRAQAEAGFGLALGGGSGRHREGLSNTSSSPTLNIAQSDVTAKAQTFTEIPTPITTTLPNRTAAALARRVSLGGLNTQKRRKSRSFEDPAFITEPK